MNWFETSGIANIAKSALKEAQRTIDKALDIKEESITVPDNTPVDTNSEDFFGTWGLTQSGNFKSKTEDDIITKSPTKVRGSSIWGSFTGSFFDPYSKDARESFRKQTSYSVDSCLDDSSEVGAEHFSSSKLVVVQSIDESQSGFNRLSNCDFEDMHSDKGDEGHHSYVEIVLDDAGNSIVTRRDAPNRNINRLSVVSTESERKSSESVEIIGDNTECTTSPDSEALSTSSLPGESKHASESIEVVENITSPSSIEVITPDSLVDSQITDEFVSPLQSPEEICNIDKMSPEPDSVEVIPEDAEENSIAEDTISYNSLSESTAPTVLDGFNVLMRNKPESKPISTIKSECMVESMSSDISLSPDKSDITITKPPTKTNMHLPLQVNLIDTQPHSYKQDFSSCMVTSNVIEVPLNSMLCEVDEGSQSDKTMIASDLTMESSSEASTTTESNSNSLYLKNMIADAMSEKKSLSSTESIQITKVIGCDLQDSISALEMPPRDTSPLSSESRSDLVKIGSDHTSGHTSGDELETTNSSDIEIISSPNGDSSSTHSRHSPAKLSSIRSKGDPKIDHLLEKMTFKKLKGHNRELSAASSTSDDNETDKLLKRIGDMSKINESLEIKIMECCRKNSELLEVNKDLKKQIDVMNKKADTTDLSQVTEEYTKRLSALEKKFQQAIREKDNLRKQLEQCKLDNATRMSKGEMETLMEEKDEIISELREEGAKLSKQQLQNSNIIKKLRAKEKENELTIKNLKENVEDLISETERLKRSLGAKEEVERSQIEAVHKLTAQNKKLTTELNHIQEKFDDLSQKHDVTKKSLDAAKKELADKNRANTELMEKEQMLESLTNEKRMTDSQNEEILNQIDDLRTKIRETEQDYFSRELVLKSEKLELLRRLEDAECRNEELSQSVLEVSKPLVRQLETLQAMHNIKVSSFEKMEQNLLAKLAETQSKLQNSLESEKIARNEYLSINTKLSTVETQLGTLSHENEMLKMNLEQQKTESLIEIQQLKRQIDDLNEKMKSDAITIESLQKEVDSLQHTLTLEKSVNESERKRNKEKDGSTIGRLTPQEAAGNTSPTLSIGRLSLSESLNSSYWPDEPFESNLVPRCTNMLEMQLLQTNLKQKDGDVQQLQWELNRREHERSLLNNEISNLLSRVDELEIKVQDYDKTQKELLEIQQQYETLCQLYGEKVEETEELKLDLQDVKEMYKAQIDELLNQQKMSN